MFKQSPSGVAVFPAIPPPGRGNDLLCEPAGSSQLLPPNPVSHNMVGKAWRDTECGVQR
jgi:hypothetical protein